MLPEEIMDCVTEIEQNLEDDAFIVIDESQESAEENDVEMIEKTETSVLVVRADQSQQLVTFESEYSVNIVDSIFELPEEQKPTTQNKPKTRSEILTIYPPPPAKGGITINVADYKCLAVNEFLNDIIIDFYLKYLMQEVLSPVDQQRTHVFSTYFFTRLAKPYQADVDKSVKIEESYDGVRKWTKNINIFEKDFIIVPINEHCHWFLVIICFSYLVGQEKSDSPVCFVSDDEVKKPCILIFDSLSGKSERIANMLTKYLECEFFAKMNQHKSFSKDVIPIIRPKVQKQSNATDCGLYLLQYVESFFKKPIEDFTTPFKDLSDWFEHNSIISKREEIARLIAKLTKKYHKNESINLPTLTFPVPEKKPLLEQFIKKDWKPLTKRKTQYESIFSPKKPSRFASTSSSSPIMSPKSSEIPKKSLSTISIPKKSATPKQNRYGRLEIVISPSSGEEASLESSRPQRQKISVAKQSRTQKCIELGAEFLKKREKNALKTYSKANVADYKCLAVTKEAPKYTTKEKFYNFSFMASKNDSSISPRTSYGDYRLKIKKKLQQDNAENL